MDLETFFTELYVLIDDWYNTEESVQVAKHAGAVQAMSDSEVLTMMVASQWRVGVVWRSERGMLRWLEAYGRGMFPRLLKRSAFNERGRQLCGAFVKLHQAVADRLGCKQAGYEVVDGQGVPAFSNGQALRENGHWLWESQKGHGGTHGGFFYGDRLLACVTQAGVITGWLLASANVNERWVLQAFLSARAGLVAVYAPPPDPKSKESASVPPVERIGPFQAVGSSSGVPYVVDRGFNGQRWIDQWRSDCQATVLAVPPDNAPNPWSAAAKHHLAAWRQIIETVFSILATVFALDQVQAHSYQGLYTRVAAKAAAFNLGLLFNRQAGRPDLAHATLLL